MSAEPMRLRQSHDAACLGRKNAFIAFERGTIIARRIFEGDWRERDENTVTLKIDPQALDAAIESALTRLDYENLRPMQKLAVQSFIQGRDVFVSLPTGSGKSLCYWLLPSIFEHLKGNTCCTVIIVSPLDALMKDQEHSLRERGVKAIKVGADDARMEDVKKGCYELLLVSPELLLTSSEWRDMLQSTVYKEQLVGVVVDEAHCVKKWSVAINDYYFLIFNALHVYVGGRISEVSFHI